MPHLAERWRWLETPPRAWGRRSGSGDDDLSGGNTPTGVGKTGFRAHSGYLCEKHPHGRGEDRPSNDACQWCRETPPRAWGRLTANQVSVPIGGNTPTGVGKTFAVAGVPAPRRKHPHGRGEDCRLRAYRCPLLETPPRAWGRRPSVSAHETLHGNTPTGVGKTRLAIKGVFTPWKHPHGRGEDISTAAVSDHARETPPRAWGRHENQAGKHESRGNTPTGVGKTKWSDGRERRV